MPSSDPLAELAIEPITRGMVVGLGTGRAASRAIRALGERATSEALDLTCIATSDRSAELAVSLGLRVVPLAADTQIDYLFDGADEVDPELRMIKGRGGAMTREKRAAHASRSCTYIVDASKLVTRLGERFPLPIEVLDGAIEEAQAVLDAAGLDGRLRTADDGSRYLTDNGNPVLDAPLPVSADLAVIDEALDAAPCIVGHGLFLREAGEVLIEHQPHAGPIERRVRG